MSTGCRHGCASVCQIFEYELSLLPNGRSMNLYESREKLTAEHRVTEDASQAKDPAMEAALKAEKISCTSCRKAKRWCDKKSPCSR